MFDEIDYQKMTRSSSFDVRKTEFGVCLMSGLVKVVMHMMVQLSSMPVHLKQKNKVFEFDYNKMNMFDTIGVR